MTPIEPLEPRRLLTHVIPLWDQWGSALVGAGAVPVSWQRMKAAVAPAKGKTGVIARGAAAPASQGKPKFNPFFWDEINEPEEDAPVIPYAGTTGPAAPPLSGPATEAIGFDSNASVDGYYNIPPDNNVAAGPNYTVDVVNTTIEVYTKSGTPVSRQRMGMNKTTAAGSFFESQSPASSLFDAKVMYDQYAGRFVVVVLDQTDTANGDASNTSRILVAVSATSDPTGAWYFGSINSKITVQGKARWADYPGLGLDAQAIYVTGNMFGFGNNGTYAGTRLWIVPKSTFYAGGAFSSAVYNPASSVGLGTTAFTLQPAHMYGTGPSGVGTFLVSSGYVSGATDQLSVIRVSNPLSSPTFANQQISLGDIDNTSAAFPGDVPQPGTTQTLDGGDERVMNAVWRNGSLYAANTVNPPSGADAGQATAHWYRINTSNLSALTLADQGNISGEELGAGTRTFYPSVMVDAAGNMAVSFSAAGPNLLPGAYYTARLAGDAAGTTRSPGTLAAGVDYYYRTFGGDRNRWGDYSGLALDPADESTFWVFNQYAQARGTILSGLPDEDGRWGTRFAPFSMTSAIAGVVYSDNDYSGVKDAGEAGIAGRTVFLDTNNNGSMDAGEASTTTDAGGAYSFGGLLSGAAYNVRLLGTAGYVGSTASVQSVTAPVTAANFGLFPTTFAGNVFALRRDAGGTRLEISLANAALATPNYSAPAGALPALSFVTSGGGDGIRLDMSNGTPLPGGGATYGGTGGASLVVQGSGGGDGVALAGSAVTLNGGPTLSFGGVSAISVNTAGGDDSVTVTGTVPAALTLALGSGADVLSLNSTALTVPVDLGTGTSALTVNASDSTLLFSASQHLAALNLSGSSVAAVSPGGDKVLSLGGLSLGAGSTLDLVDNDMVIDPGTAVAPGLASAYAGGAWNGPGITSSAARDNANHNTGLGYATAGQLGVSTYAGQAVSAEAVVVKYTYMGDANLDGRVTGDDFVLADRGRARGLLGWVNGDFNYDGVIDGADLTLVGRAYATQGAAL